MRPLRLDLAGFTVFREPTTVDFTDVDFFALVGPTGSGKSTLLDAICFALYGTVPRWSDRRAIANVLAPSSAEARVRLIFESAGRRYAATRVVRRDGKGRVSTSQAGLEALPVGFDLADLDRSVADAGAGAIELGEVIAGTPSELDIAVTEVVGLPYEQFTTCVLLPQGAFAEFLHAKPAQRQQILVNLLGLSVYERIRDQAADVSRQAETQAGAIAQMLAGMAEATDETIAAAQTRVDTLRRLGADVDTVLPQLRAARDDQEAAARDLAALDAELTRLDRVRVPADLAELTGHATEQRTRVLAAEQEVHATEETDDRLRTELADAGDAAALHRMVDEHTEHDRLAAETAQLDAVAAEVATEHERAGVALDEATGAAVLARAAVESARAAQDAAQTADRAASLRPHLRVGEACPVCAQPVATLPGEHSPELAAARAALATAEKRATAADKVVTRCETTVRDLDRSLAAARARRDALRTRHAQLTARLADSPGVVALRAELAALAGLQRAAEEAGTAVRAARERLRRAQTEASRATHRVTVAWQEFDTVRDGVAPLAPPPVDRADLAGSWAALADWAGDQRGDRTGRRTALTSRLTEAASAGDAAGTRILALFEAASVDLAELLAAAGSAARATRGAPGRGVGVDLALAGRAAAVAVERAVAAHDRLVERREQAGKLREQQAGYEREAQVARSLATHLRANNFERWLLEEALDLLVEGGSRILRELSGGQYELVHSAGEFAVVDHHDAGLRRPVRTLSGGETFQASLALALALAEQLAGMSGAASLESILLDEGFGTLDAATLDAVAATLENLAARGDRMVGVVTHVSALAERIPVRFEVHKDARTARVDRVG